MRTTQFRWTLYVAGLAASLAIPRIVSSSYALGVVNMGLITVIAALGLNISLGYCGLINVGQAGFWGIGAYTAALLATKLSWPFFLTVPAAVVAAAAAGLLMGLAVLRLKGIYLSMATIGFALMIQLTMLNWRSVTNGADGISGIPLPSIGSLKVTTPPQLYFVLLGFTVLTIVFSYRIEKSKYGRAMRAINENEFVTELMGVNTFREKTLSFCLSAGLGGLSGALLAHGYGYVSPEQFGFNQTVMFIVLLVLGGIGNVPGAVLGALFLTLLPEFIRPLRFWSMTIYGGLVTFFILVIPGGLISLPSRLKLSESICKPDSDLGKKDTSGGPVTPIWTNRPQNLEEAVLEVSKLSISFGGLRALSGVDMKLCSGRVHALIGPNGAGKSTFVNCLTGAYRPDQGSISLFNRSIVGSKPYQISRHGISRTFQNLALWKELSVLDNLLIAARGRQSKGFWPVIFNSKGAQLEEENARTRAKELLLSIDLWTDHHRPVGTLPYGHQKMIEIIRALMTGPKVILLDEPAAGLTLPEINLLKRTILAIKNQGIAVMLIEHNIDLVMDIADSVSVLNFGELISTGTPQMIQTDPKVIKAYLGADNPSYLEREVKTLV